MAWVMRRSSPAPSLDLGPWDFPANTLAEPLDSGLINQSWAVRDPDGHWLAVCQRLNTGIFVPEVHEDIEAVTSHLASRGLHTPRLIRTRSGDLWHTDPDGGVWRCLTAVGNRTVEKLTDLEDARSGGALVARFHAALADCEWDFRSVRPGAHDTDQHVDRMLTVVDQHRRHRLWWPTADLAETVMAGWGTWSGPTDLPRRVIHGDLKISNLRYQDAQAVALIDLDTLQWGTLDVELGDAMRSWCNPAAEDSEETHFDLEIFEAAMQGYAAGATEAPPTATEWAAIVPGIERICWELAARFARDALEESYFGWDPAFGGRGEHNLLRARGQARLARSVRSQRDAAQALLTDLTNATFPG